MTEDTLLPFSLPSVQRKKITAAFDGGRMTSDGGVMLLAAIESSLGIATRLASVIADPRNPALESHSVADILRARMLAIALDTRTGTTLIICAPIPASSSPANACLTAVPISAGSQPCRAWKMHRTCAR